MYDKRDFEAGDEFLDVERQPRAGIRVGIDLAAEEAGLLDRVAEIRGVSLVQAARDILVACLPDAVAAEAERTTDESEQELTTGDKKPAQR